MHRPIVSFAPSAPIALFALVTLTMVAAVACDKVPAKDAVKVTCSDSVNSLGDKAKDGLVATCPAGCTTGSVWGTDVYTTDSSICSAAVHAGVIQPAGGDVTVTLASGLQSYSGSNRHGVSSSDWGPFQKSFTVK